MTEIICKRCLLNDLTDDDKFRTVYEYIESLPKESRAAPEVERRRLAFCMKCEHLINGMCELCGCFVEVRAAKSALHCAKSKDIW